MEKKCDNCGKTLKSQAEQEEFYRDASKSRYWYGSFCDGEMTEDVDPFAWEIHGDDTLYWDCEGSRHESAMDI